MIFGSGFGRRSTNTLQSRALRHLVRLASQKVMQVVASKMQDGMVHAKLPNCEDRSSMITNSSCKDTSVPALQWVCFFFSRFHLVFFL